MNNAVPMPKSKEALMPFYEKMWELIEKRLNGRKIALLGDSAAYREFLRKKSGLTDVLVLTTVKKKVTQEITYIGEIKDRSSEYFIIVPRIRKTFDLQMKLYSCGYTDFEDCFFVNHSGITVDEYIEDYDDDYNNHIHAPSCKVILDEYVCDVTVDIGKDCHFGENTYICARTTGGARIRIGKHCVFEKGVTLTVFGDADVTIGDNTTFVRGTEIIVLGGMTFTVGKDCLFSCELKIYCGDGHSIFDLRTKKRLNPQNKDNPKNIISIGNHVWVGMRCIILNRTIIGDSCVVGAGSVVKGTYPNNCIIAGTPVRVIRKDITWQTDPFISTIENIPDEYLTPTED